MIGRTANTVIRRSRQQARPPRKVCPFCFEGDHIGGRNHIEHLIVEVCQLHHAMLTELRLAAGAEMAKQPNPIKSVERRSVRLRLPDALSHWALRSFVRAWNSAPRC
jgi:hypothetical protein